MRILLVDDEQSICVTLSDALAENGHTVDTCNDGLSALRSLTNNTYDCLITDVRLPGMTGDELVKKAIELDRGIFVLVITGYATVPAAVLAMKQGAFDYIQKPFLNEEILFSLDKIDHIMKLRAECQSLKLQLAEKNGFSNIIGQSKPMQKVYSLINAVSTSDANVLIVGETGTGKELAAKAIHFNSTRKNGPFMVINCAMPEALVEDDLFGHDKGAFTDARTTRAGKFETADKGTIFIDDIDDLPVSVQVKILRVLQEKTFERLGSSKSIKVDVRIIAATKIDLLDAVKNNRFREDLYYRLNVVTIPLPPLRDRTDDIPRLLAYFLEKFSNGRKFTVSPAAMCEMMSYSWPGNVREFENSVQRAIALSGDSTELSKEHLLRSTPSIQGAVPLSKILDEAEANYIRLLIAQNNGERNTTADALGISRKTLWEKMQKYGIK